MKTFSGTIRVSGLCVILLWTSLQPAVTQMGCSGPSDCYFGISNLQDYLLQNSADALFNKKEQQVIIPRLRFLCLGYLASWSAHVLVLARPNFLNLLPHVIQFQVWRPDERNQSYTLVGSNTLLFQGSAFRDSVNLNTSIPETGLFNLTEQIPIEDQILVQPGDVVGWYTPNVNAEASPLRPLFRSSVSSDGDHVVKDVLFTNSSEQVCAICDSQSYSRFSSVVPLLSATINSPNPQNSCTSVCTVTTDAVPTDETTPPDTTSTPNPTGTDEEIRGSPSASETKLSTAETISIVIATLTFVLHIIMILFCAANFALLRNIRNIRSIRVKEESQDKELSTFNSRKSSMAHSNSEEARNNGRDRRDMRENPLTYIGSDSPATNRLDSKRIDSDSREDLLEIPQ